MRDRALADIGDDLHVCMRMRGKSRVGGDLVVVPHSQAPVAETLRVVIAGEGEVMLRLEPAVVCAAKGGERSPLDHDNVLRYITLRVVPTVDVQRCPSDIGSRRACEKCNCRSDLFGLAIASERSPRRQRGRKVAVAGWIHVGVDWAWLYVVDRDALRSEVACPAAGISGYRALGCAVVATTRSSSSSATCTWAPGCNIRPGSGRPAGRMP